VNNFLSKYQFYLVSSHTNFDWKKTKKTNEYMIGVNKVILVGNVGKNPDVVSFPSDGSMPVKKASFPLATTEYRRNRDNEKVEITEWHNVVCWRGLADIAERILHKGSQIYVEGRLQSRSWEDKEGNKRHVTEVVADNLLLLSKRQGNDDGQQVNNPLADILNNETEPLGDLPF
jgi:single-strand DNA-binding protein